jgi:hypothetical protein
MGWSKRGSNFTQQCLAVYLNPFSPATTAAKIPDGESTYSCGERFQASGTLVNDNHPEVYILLRPHLVNPVIIASDSKDNPSMDTDAEAVKKDGTAVNATSSNSVSSGTTMGYPYTEAESARLVSMGIKFTLVNTGDNAAGVFEAIRVPAKDTATAVPQFDELTSRMIENPTYVSGKLNDIGKYAFQLKPQNTSHEFMGGTTADTNYDSILVKVTGNANTGATGYTSKLLWHVCMNVESIYGATSPFQRFHTPSVKDVKGLHRCQNIVQSNMRAARRLGYN